jgi:hypothetical protein
LGTKKWGNGGMKLKCREAEVSNEALKLLRGSKDGQKASSKFIKKEKLKICGWH